MAPAHSPMLLLQLHGSSGLTLPEATWRSRADAHAERVRALLSPGFVPAASQPLTQTPRPPTAAAEREIDREVKRKLRHIALDFHAVLQAAAASSG